jgi:hypothetical protein
MKIPLWRFAVSALILAILDLMSLSAARAESSPRLITFDDLPSESPGEGWARIPTGYGGLQWTNFGVLDGTAQKGSEGYFLGTVSRKNVAFNLNGDPASISRSAPFTLKSAYITEAFLNHMQLRVQGFLGTTLRYDNVYGPSASAPTLFSFNYVGVDRVIFTSLNDSQFAMDNLLVVLDRVPPPPPFAPPAGRYAGVLRVTKKVDGVIASTTTQANASVSKDGLLTVVLATLQNPTPQDTRPDSTDPTAEKGPTDVLRAYFSTARDSILIEFPQSVAPGANIKYTPYPAQVTIDSTRFALSYTDPANGLSSPPLTQRVTQFEYTFRRTGN